MVPFYEHDTQRFRARHLHESFHFPAHLHPQVEVVCCLVGQMQLVIEESVYSLHAGDVAFVFPGIAHQYLAGQDDSVESLILIFDPSYVPDFARALSHQLPASPRIPANKCGEEAAFALQALVREWAQGKDEAALRALTTLLLARTLPHAHLSSRPSNAGGDLLHRAMVYLSERYAQSVTLKQTARDLGISPYHLSRQFSTRLGIGFCAYVNALRLNHAEMLLKYTDVPITQIAYTCGFESQRTFNRVFAGAHHMTPRQFRQV